MPKVSVIIPTYNRPKLLARAIASVLAQTFGDFEIIVVQNGEQEYAKPVVQEFIGKGASIRYFYETKTCAVNARNVGVLQSKGKYIAFLDDDDEWFPEKLTKQISQIECSPEIGFVGCKGLIVEEGGRVKGETEDLVGNISFRRLVTSRGHIKSLSSVLIKRECFDQIGLFDEDYKIAHDFDLYLRIAKFQYKGVVMEEPLYRYFVHGENITRDLVKTLEEAIQIFSNITPSMELGVTQEMLQETVTAYFKKFYDIADDALHARNYRKALKCFIKAVRHRPFIGARVSWTRFPNPVYQVLRPYFWIVYCGVLSMIRRDGFQTCQA